MNKLIATYFGLEQDKLDIEKIINDSLKSNYFTYKNNQLSFHSPFTQKEVNVELEFVKVTYDSDFKLLLTSQIIEAVMILNEDKIEKKLNKQDLWPFFNSFIEDAIKYGKENNLSFFEFISYLFYKTLFEEKFDKNNKSLAIIFISYLLNFLGYYIKFDKKYSHAGLNYWSSLIELEFENKDITKDRIIRFKNILIDNLYINYMNPLFFDDGENKNEFK
ncbi:hypothetical protein [Malacoplasma iowae]|uniref:Uncharacterized protein n=1 Tax=Malacoplasma iowae 695 TaxID=1048830 RepID=A0A6P1LCH7_MALIO|nr:hypothetical protein [Malacoplasma iowae]VEU62267.1 Uncharacterised protein [Mycoplasmopsis fermentans]EGZ31247.1 hypothetical protein GUU_02928 [Malacoplasma iowae 695]QHG89887.1 hypothetical protein EER00_03255 [Malacoplasma iowae 695]WPL35301.1 hypothetical protein QX180_03135 [Malacoplasma iowae]VEU72474.1 Uncharacterised protein [Malacoplasma iowae]